MNSKSKLNIYEPKLASIQIKEAEINLKNDWKVIKSKHDLLND